MIRRCLLATLVAAVLAPASPAPAAVPSSVSTNWAGYAVTRRGVSFTRVGAAWTVPAVSCAAGGRRWSAAWVGLGGYASSSSALEQVGTESDCESGRPRYSSWYELVPDVSHGAGLRVHPGDRMTASVTVHGSVARLRLADDTTGRVFSRHLVARVLDLSSAEWIVEAPSSCTSAADSSCQIMPLADFGAMRMSHARVRTARGATGTIADPRWNAVRIDLSPSVHRFDGPGGGPPGGATAAGSAATGALSAAGDAFAVDWSD